MEPLVCVQCRSPLRPGAKFCPVCGAAQLQSPAHQCPHCLSPLRAEAKFCPVCGRQVDAPPAVQAQPQPASLFRRRWMLIAAIVALIIFTVIGTLVTIRNNDLETPETAVPRVAATLTAQAATPTLRAP